MKYFFRFIFVFSLLSISVQSYAQDWTLIMEMLVTEDGKKLSGAEINVYRDGNFVEKVLTDGKGQADIPMKPGGKYSIEIGGNKGLIKKKLEINTNNVPPEDLSGETYFPAEVDIFKKLDGLDYNILEKPIGKILYDPSIGGFDADRQYTKEMKSKLEQLQEDYLAQKEKEAELAEQKKKQYDAAIKAADKAFGNEEWELAEREYKRAAELMPAETYPSFQLAELQTKLIKIRETNEKYNDAIQKADAAVASKDYKTAVAEYRRASGYKPDEDYPKNKLAEVQNLLANQAKVEQNYLTAIEKGDNALKVNDLNSAKEAFEEATSLKPDETYPKNKLAEINDILQKKQQKEEDYNNAITTADQALEAKDYKTAKTEYQKALSIKPTESYPTEQIAKVDELMAAAAKKEQEYLAAIETADKSLAAKKYEEAKTAYESASSIKPEEEYPKSKIKEIDDFIAKQEAKAEEYQAKIDAADKALADKKYQAAKTAYNEAAQIKPMETYPKEKITEIEGILANLAQQEENYNAAIKKGDEALAAENYEAAKTAYNEALSIKPDEQYPQDKLGEIETIVVEMEQMEEEYNKAIVDGDDALAANDLEKAKGFYQAASKLKPEEQYPKDKIAEIDTKISAQAELEKNYTAALEAGDAAMGEGNLEKAKEEYSKAAGLKPEAQPPKDKLAEIESMIAEKEAKQAEYQAALDEGDQALAAKELENAKAAFERALEIKSNESYPKEKISEIEELIAAKAKKQEDYKTAIDKADKALKEEKYEEAKAAYKEALSIKEDEYPKTKISEIDQKLDEIAAAEAAEAKLEADYQAAISEGDQKLSEQKYDEAISAFNQALELKPEEEYPAEKISEIKAVQEKLAKEKAEAEQLALIQAEYDSLIQTADQKLEAEKLKEARIDYQAASALKSDEEYPKGKIEEINGILADAAEQDKLYQETIAQADQLLGEEKWEEAKAKYTEASSIKSEDSYPKEKIAEIDTKLEEIAAKQEEIRLQQEREAEKETKYQELVTAGDQLLSNNDFSEAKTKFEEALAIKDEQYPKDKIAEIETKLSELASQKEQAEIDAEYQGLIVEADALLKEEKFEEAKSKYQSAIAVKDEQYPKDQINQIENQLTALAEQKAAEAAEAEQAKIDANYQAEIALADKLLEESKLEEAKAKYQAALEIKEEQYPKDQIAQIEDRLAALAEEKAAKDAAEAQAKKEAKYQALINQADALLGEGKLKEAKGKYEESLVVKEDPYPAQQIAKIENQIKSIAEQEAVAAKAAKIDADYLAAIEKGDQAFQSSQLDQALNSYKEAAKLKPSEQYPKNKITEIEKIRANNQAEQEEESRSYNLAIAEGDSLFQEKQYQDAITSYNIALSIKPDQSYPFEKIQEIEQILADIAAKEKKIRLENEREAKNEASYQTAIANADKYFNEEQYNEAENEYRLAKSLKPSETYPQERLDRIKAILAARQEEQKRTEQKDAKYQELIESADASFQDSDYRSAKSNYESALTIKPNQTYPKEQIKLINAKLEEEKLAKEEELKKMDEPIQVRKGPKATITDDAEAKIDQMYKEIWAKRNEEKNKSIEEKKKVVDDLNDKNREEEEKKRENALEKIEAISVSLRESKKMVDKTYLQNYETVKEKERAIAEEETDNRKEAERRREHTLADKERLRNDIQTFQKERNEVNLEGKKEWVENENEEVNLSRQKRSKDQAERMEESKKKFIQKEEDISSFNRKKREDNLHKNTSEINQVKEDWKSTINKYTKDSQERIENENQSIDNKRSEIQRFERENKESFKENQKQLEERTEVIAEYESEKRKDSRDRINLEQQRVNDREIANQQFASERKDSFKKNQKAIEEKEKVLNEVTQERNQESEKRRQKNLDKEYYEGEDKPRQDPESADYPQGVTEKIIENDNNSTTIRRIVVDGTQTDIYEKTLYPWGGVFYTKNGTNITEEIWDRESR